MNEFEKLKQICDKIWYKYYKYKYEIPYNLDIDKIKIDKDVREIIFTKEFMDKLETKLMGIFWPNTSNVKVMLNWILYHLDNPVEYLYNLIN